jgi:hypothetical protein
MKNSAMSRRHFLGATAVLALANSVLYMPALGQGNNSVWDMQSLIKGF